MTGKFTFKRLVAICLISILCFVILGVFFFRKGSQIVFNQAKNEAMQIAQTAAGDIDGDVFLAIKEKDSQGFRDVYDKLSKYKSNKSLGYIYSMKKSEEENLVFVVDTDEVAPADIFEPYEWLPGMVSAFDGEVCADEDFTSDEWGTYLSGYAPILDSKDTVVGIVGCDITIGTINDRLAKLRILIILFGVIPNIIIAMMLWKEAKS